MSVFFISELLATSIFGNENISSEQLHMICIKHNFGMKKGVLEKWSEANLGKPQSSRPTPLGPAGLGPSGLGSGTKNSGNHFGVLPIYVL